MDFKIQNTQYGSFQLKAIYKKNFLIGIISAAALHLLIVAIILIILPKGNEDNTTTVRIKLIPYNELGPPPSIIEKEITVEKIITEKQVFGNPVAAKKGEPVSEFKMPGESSGLQEDVKVEEQKPELKKEEKVEAPYLISVDMMPEPYGGLKEIQNLLVYPKAAKNSNIEGRVLVKAFINENGQVTRSEIVKGIGYGCDEEAIRVVGITSFRPGKLNGRYVNVQLTIPVVFSLNN